jgi:hypothetical protein
MAHVMRESFFDLQLCGRAALVHFGFRSWPGQRLLRVHLVPSGHILFVQAGGLHPPFNQRGRLGISACGLRLPGEWDKEVLHVQETEIFRGLSEHFLQGKDWEHTCLHPDRYRCEHPNLPIQYNRYDRERFLIRGRYLDRLYDSLASGGWNTSRESRKRRLQTDGLYVNVTRDGHLVRDSGGLHRLILAQILGLYVPVRLNVVHSECDITAIPALLAAGS